MPWFTSFEEKRMKSILDPAFRYTPSVATDVSKTFARIRRELRAQNSKAMGELPSGNVLALLRREPLPLRNR